MTENSSRSGARGERPDAEGQRAEATRAGKRPSRRDLLRGGGILAVGAGGLAAWRGIEVANHPGETYFPEEFSGPQPRKTPGFDHLVVVMGENRSFDNVFGYLYTPDDPPKSGAFEGLSFGSYSNTASDGTVVPAHVYSEPTDRIMENPNPDPGEEYPHVNTQIYGTQDPGNRGKHVSGMKFPWNAPRPGARGDMSGFVLDYESDLILHIGADHSTKLRDQIMGSFDPKMLPVLSTLARGFGVFDHWHCAVPSQTFCNRSFFHASTSHGFVGNSWPGKFSKWLDAPETPTVFNRLEEAGKDWRIYHDELQLISFTGLIHAPSLEKFWRTEHFATMQDFYRDVREGTLPEYSFIEPRMIFNHNDFHPPSGPLREGQLGAKELVGDAISDVRAGEALIHEIYTAIRNSVSKSGSNYLNTSLLITFDEHGGTYDHVVPPAATPPSDAGAGELGFAFDQLGCRVPAVLVSAHTRRGSVFSHEMHHGSVIASLSERFGLAPLTARDTGAPSLQSAFNREIPRHAADWPQTVPAYVPPNLEDVDHPASAQPDHPLSPPARGLLGLLLSRYGTAEEKANPPQTFQKAYEVLHKYGQGLFGVNRGDGSK